MDIDFQIDGRDEYEPLQVYDMDGGALVIEQRNEATGKVQQLALTYEQLAEAVARLAPRHDKNTEPKATVAA